MIKRNVEVELVLSAGGGVYSEWSRGSVLRFSFLPNDPANIAAPVLESYKDQIGIESIDSAQ
uniref:Bm389, isoform b n=1 Tax=Brugia malayi TaxID=6279 RepID=A0A1I9G1C6_BRUMA|nr:Bm389, isoform b [Brugia malayi]